MVSIWWIVFGIILVFSIGFLCWILRPTVAKTLPGQCQPSRLNLTSCGALCQLVSPTSLTITWRSAIGTALSTAYLPANAVYTRINTVLEATDVFDADFVEAFKSLDVSLMYQYSRNVAFVRYKDASSTEHFALIALISPASKAIVVSTAGSIDDIFDPSEYQGAWNYTYNNISGTSTTYLEISTLVNT